MKKVRNVTPDKFFNIERIWAENGVVKTQSKDGRIVTMLPKEAAKRAAQINSSKVPDDLRRGVVELVEKIVTVVKEAMSQTEDHLPDKKTKAVQDGLKSVERAALQYVPEETAIIMYPELKPDEIRAVLRADGIDPFTAKKMLDQMNNIRRHAKLT
jgi:hypothetical protein